MTRKLAKNGIAAAAGTVLDGPLRQMGSNQWEYAGIAPMTEDQIEKDAAEFRERLQAGKEKFLTDEERVKWRESFRRQQETIRKQFEGKLNP